ncbi:MAG: hypothetical protein Q4C06_01080, partial [Bacillota bacterium]|nr:hypothetical protein [Bacillota bacterium]
MRSKIYKEVSREMDFLRTGKLAEQKERKQALYKRLPRLEEIERELALLGTSAVKRVAMHGGNIEAAVKVLQEEQKKLMTEREEILERNGFSPEVLQVEYVCKQCRDTGYIDSQMCSCMKRRIMEKMYNQSNVSQIIAEENFDTFDLRLFSDVVVPEEGVSPRENAKRNLKMAMAFARD